MQVKYYNKEHNTTFVITSHYTKDIQEMCKRVFVLNKGKQVYDGDFKTLVHNINPKRRLIFEFVDFPDDNFIEPLKNKFTFELNDKLLTAILSEIELQKLLNNLLKNHVANNISFEDIPVDDAMRNFFQNPEKYIK